MDFCFGFTYKTYYDIFLLSAFQMNVSMEDVGLLSENSSILRQPLLLEKSEASNVTIIVSANGSVHDQMFLNTVAAQALSGIFVWSALLITFHQVSELVVLLVLFFLPGGTQITAALYLHCSV